MGAHTGMTRNVKKDELIQPRVLYAKMLIHFECKSALPYHNGKLIFFTMDMIMYPNSTLLS
jgi:hypothetical protein